MKKMVLVVIVLIVMLAGCGTADNLSEASVDADIVNTTPDDKSPTKSEDVILTENILNTLSTEEYIELNRFLSNFAETPRPLLIDVNSVDEYYRMQSIMYFAVGHIFLNDRQSLTLVEYGAYPFYENKYSVAETKVDAVLNKYFGIERQDDSPTFFGHDGGGILIYFENGKCYFKMWEAGISDWTQATFLFDNHDGTYTVLFDIYTRGYYADDQYCYGDFPPNRYAPKENWGDFSNIESKAYNTAVIKKGAWNGNEVWQLISCNNRSWY